MAIRNNSVTIKVDKNYFENHFEPERRSLEKRLGLPMTQTKFTAYLANSGAKIQFPKSNKKFSPKIRGLNFKF